VAQPGRAAPVLSFVRNFWGGAARPIERMNQITVNTPSNPYVVLVGRGLLRKAGAALATLRDYSGVFVLSSARVWKHWGRAVEASLKDAGPLRRILFDDAERAKTLATYEKVCRQLVREGADRRALLLAVGGGVVGDVAGFVAATYLRGVRLVHVPTTLMAQVDSAIGGKTGVNLREGKNLIGAFYQPRLVLADPQTLGTLPVREFRAGLYEVIKYGILGDAELFGYLEENLADILKQTPQHLDWMITRCVEAKAGIVGKDETESGLREVLNLGHTFAHALETATGYRTYRHGEAVGWGLLAAARLAAHLKMLPAEDCARILALVRRVGALPAWPRSKPEALMQIMRSDKKARGGRVRFVLPKAIASVETGVEASDETVREVLRQMAAGRGAS